ncbi:MAG: VCBS repeat-containing protein, partial [Rhodothermales bacterium]|nr:VCBS repeat-containing protein [Rhodothermales bacterium]
MRYLPRFTISCFLFFPALLFAQPAFCQPYFDAPWRAFPTGTWETGRYDVALEAADLNGDGRPDAAVGQSTFSGGVRVLLNEGTADGDPATFGPDGTFYPTTYDAWDLAAADLDGDGDTDLAATNSDSFHLNGTLVAVFLHAGDGTFSAAVYYEAGPAGPHGIAAADYDGDGDADLAVANLGFSASGTAVSLLLNDGSGGFAPPVSYDVAEGPYRLAAGDLDGDGDPDLAVAHEEEHAVSVLLNNGDGTFAAADNYPDLYPPLNVSSNADVVLADFDTDGDLDALYSNTSLYNNDASEVQLILLRNEGDGTFAAPEAIGYGVLFQNTPFDIEATDLDGDGDPDVVAAHQNDEGFFVLLGDGAGGFAPAESYAAADFDGEDGSADAVATADLDGDGDPDVLTVSRLPYLLTVHENLGDGAFSELPVQGTVLLHNALDAG